MRLKVLALCIAGMLVFPGASFGGTPKTASTVADVYAIGEEIAEGLVGSIDTGLKSADSGTACEFTTKRDKLAVQQHTFPILDVRMECTDKKSTFKIGWVLIMEMDKNVPVATVKMVKLNGKAVDSSNAFHALNNTMYVETDEGTEQVKRVGGKLVFVE